MKKWKRWIAILLMSVMCLSLCGCQSLEDMRAAHAFWQEDGSIRWNGNVYRRLDDVPDSFQLYTEHTVCVTEADVPVLLSDWLGDEFTADEEGVMLHSWYWEGEETYFCREDKFEEMATYFQQDIELDTYFYTYWPVKDGKAETAYYYLSDEEKYVINELFNVSDFNEVEDDFYNSFEEGDFSVVLGRCDGKHLFAEHYALEIVFMQGEYYLFADGLMAVVPSTYNAVFEEIVADYYEWEVLPYSTKQ